MIDREPPEVSICIPTLGYGDLGRLLDSIAAHTAVSYEIVIVHSGNRVRGFPVPMNQALRAARGRIIIGLNDDVEVTAGWAEPLVEAIDAGAWVVSPDQTSTDGNQCFCGWCVAFDRYALYGDRLAADTGKDGDLFYDERFGVWCTDVDLAKRLHALGRPPVRVALPEPLRHALNATQTQPEVASVIRDEAAHDLDRYEQKWGSRAETDKFELAP